MKTAPPEGGRVFHIQSCLGTGGFGEVYRVTMTSPGGISRDVALKMLHQDVGPEAQSIQRLRDEGRLLAQLDHPVILRVFDFARLGDRVGLITEFVNGQDLTDCIRPPSPMPTRVLAEVIAAVASALDAAWDAPAPNQETLQLVHRDIKPSNIRISHHGSVKLLDFGIARSQHMTREAHTQTDTMVGSWMYMAPERFLHDNINSAADVYSLGCVLYEGIAGQPLFQEKSPMVQAGFAMDANRFSAWVRERLSPYTTLPALAELITDCLNPDPHQRPTARQVSQRCEMLCDTLDGPSLRQWALDRHWPEPTTQTDLLVGKTIHESTLSGVLPQGSSSQGLAALPPFPADANPTAAFTRSQRSGPSPWLWAALALGGVGLAVLLLASIAVVAWVMWPNPKVPSDGMLTHQHQEPSPTDNPTQQGQQQPLTGPAHTSHPVPAAVVHPTPEPKDTPAPSSPKAASPSRTNPTPAPVKAAPHKVSPTKATPPQPIGPVGTIVQVDSTIPLKLLNKQDQKTYRLGEVPIGSYQVLGKFGQTFADTGYKVNVKEGKTVRITCNTLTSRCRKARK